MFGGPPPRSWGAAGASFDPATTGADTERAIAATVSSRTPPAERARPRGLRLLGMSPSSEGTPCLKGASGGFYHDAPFFARVRGATQAPLSRPCTWAAASMPLPTAPSIQPAPSGAMSEPANARRPSATASASNVPSLNQVGGTESQVPWEKRSPIQSWPAVVSTTGLGQVHVHRRGHGVVIGQVDAVLHREAHEQASVPGGPQHEPGVDRRVPPHAEVGLRGVVDDGQHLRDPAGMALGGGPTLRLGERRVELDVVPDVQRQGDDRRRRVDDACRRPA